VYKGHEGAQCLDDTTHIVKDKALRLITNQSVLTPQAIGIWLRRLGKDSTPFTYGPDRSRYQKVQTRSSDNTTITTQYFGKIYEKIKQNTNTEHKHFIYADGQLIAIHIKTDTTSAAGTSSTTDTPVTVTVCGVFQLPLVKVNDGVTVATLVLEPILSLSIETVTSPIGCLSSTMV
jgi:hypothetical protein